jgi:hypothetical protein
VPRRQSCRVGLSGLINQGRVQAFGQIAPLDVKDGGDADLQHRGNISRRMLSMQQIENTGACLDSCWRRAFA